MAHQIIPEICSGCGVCALKCPVQAITGATAEPHVVISTRCVNCRVCGRWCLWGAVLDETGTRVPRIRAEAMPKARVDVDSCSGCEMCASVCSQGALSMKAFDEGIAHASVNQVAFVDDGRCSGCQLCEDICSTHAIRVDAGELDRPSALQRSNRIHPVRDRPPTHGVGASRVC